MQLRKRRYSLDLNFTQENYRSPKSRKINNVQSDNSVGTKIKIIDSHQRKKQTHDYNNKKISKAKAQSKAALVNILQEVRRKKIEPAVVSSIKQYAKVSIGQPKNNKIIKTVPAVKKAEKKKKSDKKEVKNKSHESHEKKSSKIECPDKMLCLQKQGEILKQRTALIKIKNKQLTDQRPMEIKSNERIKKKQLSMKKTQVTKIQENKPKVVMKQKMHKQAKNKQMTKKVEKKHKTKKQDSKKQNEKKQVKQKPVATKQKSVATKQKPVATKQIPKKQITKKHVTKRQGFKQVKQKQVTNRNVGLQKKEKLQMRKQNNQSKQDRNNEMINIGVPKTFRRLSKNGNKKRTGITVVRKPSRKKSLKTTGNKNLSEDRMFAMAGSYDDKHFDTVDGRQNSTYAGHSSYTGNIGQTANFPFLRDQKTLRHIKSSHTMFILRGPSGSGKSTIVEFLRQKYPCTEVCSADHYFIQEDGSYWFDPSILSDAHQYSQTKAETSCINRIPVIAIDNTNTQYWEMKPYLDLAKFHNYVVIPVYPQTDWTYDPIALAEKSQHQVPLDKIEIQLERMEDIMPLYYGWFVNQQESLRLAALRKTYLEACWNTFPDFCKRWFFEKDSDETFEEMLQYFRINSEAEPILHCTAKFCGFWNRPAPNSMEYHQLDIVQNSYAKASSLSVTGFTISPRTITGRVKLTPVQLNLFDRPEEKQRSVHFTSISDADDSLNRLPYSPSNLNYVGKGRCAHITLATASGVFPVQSNFDILDICEKESVEYGGRDVVEHKVKGGMMKIFGEEFCVVYLNKFVNVTGLFSGYYT